jgi:rhodanese-related sulfurtransferase
MTQPLRISAEETRQRVSVGSALLVCAYDDEEKFKNNHLQGAISLSEFKSRMPSIAQDQEVIFYCA